MAELSTDDVTDFRDVPEKDREALRTSLIEQVEYLIDEVEALRTVASAVPEPVQSGRPTPEDLSMKEIYGLIATLDADVRPQQIDRIVSEDTPELSTPDPDALARDAGWNERDLDAVLDAVQDARRDLTEHLRSLDAATWAAPATLDGEPVTLFEAVHRFARADFACLRDLGYRLHDADLSERDEE